MEHHEVSGLDNEDLALHELIEIRILRFTAPLKKPRTEWACQPVAFMSSASEASPGRWSKRRILAVLVPDRTPGGLAVQLDREGRVPVVNSMMPWVAHLVSPFWGLLCSLAGVLPRWALLAL